MRGEHDVRLRVHARSGRTGDDVSIYRDKRTDVPNVLICSGLDPSGGAGFLADARVVSALNARPVGVVTSLTVQNTVAVQQVHAVESEVVGAQLASLLGDVEVQAVKIGLIGSPQIAREIAYGLDLTAAPVVWDPIGAPSRGNVVFDVPGFDEIFKLLRVHLTLVTPNANELANLVHRDLADTEQAIEAARELVGDDDIAVLIKGGHLLEADAVDVLVHRDRVERFDSPRIAGGEDVHGTGCMLATAITTYLAHGEALGDACRLAKEFVTARIAAPVRPGRGAPAVI